MKPLKFPRSLVRRFAWLGLVAGLAFAGVAPLQAEDRDQNFTFTLVGQSMIRTDIRESAPERIAVISGLLKGDAVFTNFEAAVVDVTKGQSPKDGRFSTPPAALEALKALGFNLYSLANNHSFDMKADGIITTIEHASRLGLTYAGTGPNLAAAGAPAYLRTPKGTVALIAIASGNITPEASASATQTGVNELRVVDGKPNAEDSARILASIREARKHADFVIVSHHNHALSKVPHQRILLSQLPERLKPPKWLEKWARAEVDAGADVISMHGTPFLHGIEIYKGKPIFYNLGNFIFQAPPASIWLDEPMMYESVVADVTFKGRTLQSVKLRPIVLNKIGKGQPDMHDQTTVNEYLKTRGLPQPAGVEAPFILDRLIEFSRPFGTKFVIAGDTAEIKIPRR